jgi:mono/diheme cytochrome c family protein
MGLLLVKEGGYELQVSNIHQWTGIATAFFSAITWFVSNSIHKKDKRSWIKLYRVFLFISAIGVAIAGHFGASLTHGKDYITATIPWSDRYDKSTNSNFDISTFKNDTTPLTKQQSIELNVKVRAIFAHNCYKCHGPEKIKGDLRLDRRDMIFKGGENGPVVIPGDPTASDLYRRITLPSNHKDAMPSKGRKLADEDIAVINFWIQKGAPWPDSSEKSIFRLAPLAPRNPTLPLATENLSNPIDLWTNQYFTANKIIWPKVVDDKTFLRRISLDLVGLVPSVEELEKFTKDSRTNKREIWIRKLLNQKDDYTLHWLSFWNDALRNDYTGTGYITGGRRNITTWLFNSLKSNKSYDQFAKELLNPTDESNGFIEGIKWRGVVNSSQRTEMQAAQNVSQIFLGLNLKCASCHNSFISDWKLTDAYAFANIFADTSLEINRCDKPTGKFTGARMLWKELGAIDSSAKRAEKLAQLATNMVQASNGRFYRTIVNRIWAQLMGRGLIEPVDVMDNEAWSQDLLDWMAFNFQQNNSDIKELLFLITSSTTYQLPSVSFNDASKIVSPQYVFKGRLRKRMSAEQFADAASTIITPIFYDSMSITYVDKKAVLEEIKKQKERQEKKKAEEKKKKKDKNKNKNKKKIDREKKEKEKKEKEKKEKQMMAPKKLPPIIGAAFVRASLVNNNPFLISLGRPTRETVSTTRESQSNLLQALELTNGDRFNSMISKGAILWKNKYITGDEIIKEIYEQALGRAATKSEYTIAKKLLGETPTAEAIEDLFWIILLLPEFQIIY